MPETDNGDQDNRPSSEHFSDEELKEFEELLLEKKEEISSELQGLRKKIRKGMDAGNREDRNSNEPDSDFVTESSELAKDDRLVEQLERNLQMIEDALEALEKGTYGICRRTGEPISKDRLQAIPWAKYSYRAQAEMETE